MNVIIVCQIVKDGKISISCVEKVIHDRCHAWGCLVSGFLDYSQLSRTSYELSG